MFESVGLLVRAHCNAYMVVCNILAATYNNGFIIIILSKVTQLSPSFKVKAIMYSARILILGHNINFFTPEHKQ